MPRRVLVLIAALSMGASLVFTSSTSAHELTLTRARKAAEERGKGHSRSANSRYGTYKTICTRMEYHFVRCQIQYYGRSSSALKNNSLLCTEYVNVYYKSESDNGVYQEFVIAPKCW
jgi:hypothetical protein